MTFNAEDSSRRRVPRPARRQLGFPAIVRAQSEPIRHRACSRSRPGALASGGIDMERGLTMFLKEKNNTIGGRKVELIVADTGGVPAQARTKMQELVERDQVQCSGRAARRVRGARHGRLHPHGADPDAAGRRRGGHDAAQGESLVRARAPPRRRSARIRWPTTARRQLKYKRMAAIADDIAYGHEMRGGFQQVFEDAGGTMVQKLFPPLNAPDYGTYIAQLKTDIDGVFLGFAGSNGFRFFRQYNEYGLKTADRRRHDGARRGRCCATWATTRSASHLGCWYTAQLDNPINKRFVAAYRADNGYDPG